MIYIELMYTPTVNTHTHTHTHTHTQTHMTYNIEVTKKLLI